MCSVEESECKASFVYAGANGEAECSFAIRDIEDGVPLRRFGVNGLRADWDGFADGDGVYRARLTHGHNAVNGDDFMHTMIQAFTDSVLSDSQDVILGPQDAYLNLELQVQLLQIARDGADAA